MKPSPRRDREHTADATRRAILAAAEEVFARDGFSGARIDAIAATAACNKSLIFHYFTDKIGLYQAVVGCAKEGLDTDFWARFHDLLKDEDAAHEPARVRDLIASAVGLSFDMIERHPALRRIMLWEAAEGWRTFRQLNRIPGPSAEIITTVIAFLRRAQAAGIVRADLNVPILLALVLGLPLTYLGSIPRNEYIFPNEDFTSSAALKSARDHVIELVLHGTLTTPEEQSHAS